MKDKKTYNKNPIEKKYNRNEKTYNKKPIEKKYNRPDKKPINNRLDILNAFDKFGKNIKSSINIKFIPPNYKQFVNKIDDKLSGSLIKKLPFILLAITTLAVKNKSILYPIAKAIYIASKQTDIDSLGKIYKVIILYSEFLMELFKKDPFESLEVGFTVLTFFLDDIPAILNRVNTFSDISSYSLINSLLKNINYLKTNIWKGPKSEEEMHEQSKQKQKENIELQKQLNEFKQFMNKQKINVLDIVPNNIEPQPQHIIDKKTKSKRRNTNK